MSGEVVYKIKSGHDNNQTIVVESVGYTKDKAQIPEVTNAQEKDAKPRKMTPTAVCKKVIGLLAKDGVFVHAPVRGASWLAVVRALARDHWANVLGGR